MNQLHVRTITRSPLLSSRCRVTVARSIVKGMLQTNIGCGKLAVSRLQRFCLPVRELGTTAG